MDTVDREVLVSLSAHHGWPAVSLYLPTHRSGSDKEQDRIRMKNLLRTACDRLVVDGMRATEAEVFCSPLSDTLEDDAFWRDTAESVVVFASAIGTWTLKLDIPVTESAVVGDRFYMRPLLAAQTGQRRFHALALSKNGCRLFAGDAASIELLPLEGAPASLADELKYDEREDSLQLTTFAGQQAAAGTGRAVGMFHGHGGEKDVEKIGLERYLRHVEHAVSKAIACESGVPLLLMGVEYEIATYRGLNTCAALVPERVLGATERMTAHQIRTAALDALEARFDAAVRDELSELMDREGSSLASRDPVEIVAAAAAGRVKTIFFDDGVGPFGVFDRERFTVDDVSVDEPAFLREGAGPQSHPNQGWDLIDLAAAETTLHGGEVHAFSGANAPVHGVAAVFRY